MICNENLILEMFFILKLGTGSFLGETILWMPKNGFPQTPYQSERNEKAAELKELEQQLDSTQAVQDAVQNWADMIRQYQNLDTLDRETLLRLIDKIEVGEKKIVDGHKEQEIRIHYKFVGFIQ